MSHMLPGALVPLSLQYTVHCLCRLLASMVLQAGGHSCAQQMLRALCSSTLAATAWDPRQRQCTEGSQW